MSAASPSTAGHLTERIVLVFLLAAAGVLGWVWWKVLPGRSVPSPAPFDLENVLLDARPGDCVAIETMTNPGSLVCVRVRAEGVVLRTRRGPDSLGGVRGLHRSAPYLACAVRYPPPGRDCQAADPTRGEDLLVPLGGFGMPYGVEMQVESIRPLWVERGGRYLWVYEVQMLQYGMTAGRAWGVYLHPDAPVLGTVLRRQGTERGEVHEFVFTAASECP